MAALVCTAFTNVFEQQSLFVPALIHPGEIPAYNHGDGSTRCEGKIAARVESYFDCCLTHRRWHPFQY